MRLCPGGLHEYNIDRKTYALPSQKGIECLKAFLNCVDR